MLSRQKVATLVAEFLGTGILTLVFLSVQRSTIGVPYFIAIAAGAAVAIAAFFFGDSSGAHMNPAITLALWTARKVNTLVAAGYIVVQLLGAWAAYGVYHYFVNTSLQPIGGHYSARILFAEAVGALILGLAWGAVFFKRFDTTNRALLLGGSYALTIIVAAAAGIGIGNPAVALGIRAWDIFGSMGWATYVLGPVLGAIIGVNLYALLFAPVGEAVVASETLIISESVVPATASSRSSSTAAKKPAAKKSTAKKSSSKKTTASRRRR